MIVFSIVPIYRFLKESDLYLNNNEDIYIAVKQISQYLIGSYYVDMDEGYHYISIDGKDMHIVLDNNRIVKKEGYEILLFDVDELVFKRVDDLVYMTIVRDEREYSFLITYIIEKDGEEYEE